jgi:hypothetical protein
MFDKYKMRNGEVDIESKLVIMSPEEVAQFFHKSISWVYKNWKILGGRKLGGSLFFPNKEDLYEHLFYQGQRVEVRFHPERKPFYKERLQNKDKGQAGRGKKKGGDKKPTTADRGDDPNRHGLLGARK